MNLAKALRLILLLTLCSLRLVVNGCASDAGFAWHATFAYDGKNPRESGYDGTSLLTFNYDSASVPISGSEENRTVETGGFFGKSPEFLAAETTAPNLLAPYTGANPWTGEIQSVVAAQDTTMYRVWGGGSQQMGAWLTPTLPTSAAQATGDLALPAANTANFYSEVVVPAGTRYQIGTAAPAFGQAGGGVQVQLLQQIPAANFGPGIALPP